MVTMSAVSPEVAELQKSHFEILLYVACALIIFVENLRGYSIVLFAKTSSGENKDCKGIFAMLARIQIHI